MEFHPNVYNEKNKIQYGLGKKLIEQIIEENEKEFNIALDIGCRTGNVTLMLNNMLNINQLYAIDIDSEMIEFAKLNNNKPNIRYIVQDIGSEWEQMSPELKALENKVSLIFTNQVLHWVIDKENAAKNLFHLVTRDGKLYANIFINSDPFGHLEGEEKVLHEKQILIPTPREQMEMWKNLFEKVGFSKVHNEFHYGNAIMSEQEYIEGILTIDVNCRKQYIIETDNDKRNEVIDNMAKRLIEKNRVFIDEVTDEEMIEWEYGIMRFVLKKN